MSTARLVRPTLLAAVSAALVAASVAQAHAVVAPRTLSPGIRVVGLTADGSLTSVDTGRDKASRPRKILGIAPDEKVVGIDYDTEDDRRLYGVARADDGTMRVFGISARTGRTSASATLYDWETREPVRTTGSRFGIDHDPQLGPMRVVSEKDENLFVDTRSGATQVQDPIRFAPRDVNAGRDARVPAIAYVRFPEGLGGLGATSTLYALDAGTDRVLLGGTTGTWGELASGPWFGKDVRGSTGFDVHTFGGLEITALISHTSRGRTRIYSVDLSTGRITGTSRIRGRTIGDITSTPFR